MEKELFERINVKRRKNGSRILTCDSNLSKQARWKAIDIAKLGYPPIDISTVGKWRWDLDFTYVALNADEYSLRYTWQVIDAMVELLLGNGPPSNPSKSYMKYEYNQPLFSRPNEACSPVMGCGARGESILGVGVATFEMPWINTLGTTGQDKWFVASILTDLRY